MKDVLSVEYQIECLAERIHVKAALTPMTPLQRYMGLATGQVPDRLPISIILAVEWGAHYLGYQLNEEFAWDPKKWAAAALVCNDRFEADACAPIYDCYVVGPDGMGAEVYFPEDSLPEIIDEPIKSPADLSRLKPFDPERDGRMAVQIEAGVICNEKVGSIAPLTLSLCGPFSWAANMRGIYRFLADLKHDPKFAHAQLEIMTEAVKESIKAYNRAGLKPFLADATASNYLISPRQIEEFYIPYYEKLQADLGADAFSGMVWGYWEPQAHGMSLPVLRGMGLNNYCYCQEDALHEEDILAGKRLAHQIGAPLNISLWGKWVQVHSPREIDEEVKRVIGLAGPEWPFMVGMWSLPVGCPIENVDAFVRALKKYGTFPITV